MAFADRFLGFDLIQRNTLANLLNADGSTAAQVIVAAGTDGLAAGTVQAALQALATRVQALEDAP